MREKEYRSEGEGMERRGKKWRIIDQGERRSRDQEEKGEERGGERRRDQEEKGKERRLEES